MQPQELKTLGVSKALQPVQISRLCHFEHGWKRNGTKKKKSAKTPPSAHSHKDQYGIQVKPATRVIKRVVFYDPSRANAAEKL